jgi:DNA-directed RNA polymerase specialized sigma24 family protein
MSETENKIVLTEEQRASLKNAIQEMVNSKYRAQAEKDLQKETVEHISKELDIPKKLINSLATRAYKQDAAKVSHEVTEVLDLAEELGFYSSSN